MVTLVGKLSLKISCVELIEGVLVGLGPQAFVLTEGYAVGEDCVDAVVHIGFVVNLVGN